MKLVNFGVIYTSLKCHIDLILSFTFHNFLGHESRLMKVHFSAKTKSILFALYA